MGALGYTDKDGVWISRSELTTADQFISNTKAQADAQEALFILRYDELLAAGVVSSITPKEKVAGVLVSSLPAGVRGSIDLIIGEGGVAKDTVTNGESVQAFYNAGYRTIAGKPTVEYPTASNINNEASDKNTNSLGVISARADLDLRHGFKDPNGTYPLKDKLNESDVPRLARGYKINQTCVGIKGVISKDFQNIPVANSKITWKQSPIPYNATYPHNSVYQSASGHVMEFDDSPGNERMHFYHKAGTFWEVDNAGNSVDKVQGIRTIIVEKDELVYIKGAGHVTIEGDMSLKINKALVVEITGNADIKVGGDVTYDVAGSFSVLAGKAISFDAPLVNNRAGVALSVKPYAPSIDIPGPVSFNEVSTIENEEYSVPPANVITSTPKSVDSKQPTSTIGIKTIDAKCTLAPIPTIIDGGLMLSCNFYVKTLLVGSVGSVWPGPQHGLSSQDFAKNLRALCLNCLEPIREKYASKGLKLNSGIRPAGNPLSKDKGISQHELGCAADISFTAVRGKPGERPAFVEIASWIRDNVLFDQLILEYTDAGRYLWIHISFRPDGNNRRKVFTMNNHKKISDGIALVA